MARVPYLTRSELPLHHQDLLDRDINLNRALVNCPSGARAFWVLGYWIRRDMDIDSRLRELVILQVGYLSRSPYEFSHHVKIALESGVSEQDIDQLIAENQGLETSLSDCDRLLLNATREIVEGPGISAQTFTALQSHFDPGQLVALTLTASFYLGVVRLLDSLAIDTESDYLPYLERFPLPI
jgi:alkylhydroperoxidase family enzyme